MFKFTTKMTDQEKEDARIEKADNSITQRCTCGERLTFKAVGNPLFGKIQVKGTCRNKTHQHVYTEIEY